MTVVVNMLRRTAKSNDTQRDISTVLTRLKFTTTVYERYLKIFGLRTPTGAMLHICMLFYGLHYVPSHGPISSLAINQSVNLCSPIY